MSVYGKFNSLCEEGDFEKIKEFYENNKESINTSRLKVHFITVCRDGNKKLVEWFCSLSKDLINFDQNEPFVTACVNGQLDVVKLLYHKGADINEGIYTCEPFWCSCINGHLEVAKWIYSINNKPDFNNAFMFENLCCKSYINVVKWLLTLHKYDTTPKTYFSTEVNMYFRKLNKNKWENNFGFNMNCTKSINSMFDCNIAESSDYKPVIKPYTKKLEDCFYCGFSVKKDNPFEGKTDILD